jgi:hypothetical protein
MAEALIRLKPHNPRKGYVTKRYHVGGILFREDRGWYRTEDQALIDRLSRLRQRSEDPDSPPLFDIVSAEEAKEIEEREGRTAGRASSATPNEVASRRATVTTADAIREAGRNKDGSRKVDASLPMIDPAADEPAGLEEGRVAELGRVTAPVEAPASEATKRRRGGGGQPARSRSMRSGE